MYVFICFYPEYRGNGFHRNVGIFLRFCNLFIFIPSIERTGSTEFSVILYGGGGITQKTTIKYFEQLDIQGDQIFICAFC